MTPINIYTYISVIIKQTQGLQNSTKTKGHKNAVKWENTIYIINSVLISRGDCLTKFHKYKRHKNYTYIYKYGCILQQAPLRNYVYTKGIKTRNIYL